jgi:hypothetical protein
LRESGILATLGMGVSTWTLRLRHKACRAPRRSRWVRRFLRAVHAADADMLPDEPPDEFAAEAAARTRTVSGGQF